MTHDYKKAIATDIVAFQFKLNIRTRRGLRTHLIKNHQIDFKESSLHKALKNAKGGIRIEKLMQIQEVLEDDCIKEDRRQKRIAQQMGSLAEFADGDKPLSEARQVMERKFFSQMPVRVGGVRIVGVLTRDSIEQGLLSNPQWTPSHPAKDFCEEARFVAWNVTETEICEEVVKHKYALITDRGEVSRIMTLYDLPKWAILLLSEEPLRTYLIRNRTSRPSQ